MNNVNCGKKERERCNRTTILHVVTQPLVDLKVLTVFAAEYRRKKRLPINRSVPGVGSNFESHFYLTYAFTVHGSHNRLL